MIETDQQRRWWFATHPEFSSSRRGERSKHYGGEDEESGGPSPEFVDKQIDQLLKHEKDDFFIDLLKDVKFWFGTESASTSSAAKDALLGDNDLPSADDKPSDAFGEDWWSQQPFTHPAVDRNAYDKYEDVLDRIDRAQSENQAREAFIREMMNAGWGKQTAEEKWKAYKLSESVAQGVAGAMTVHGAIAGARAILTGAYRWAVSLGEAGSIGKSGGPGQWVEVGRAWQGLEHQSRMSGQPIIERGGKYSINEYKIGTTPFDDYRNGILYEYKGPQRFLFDKNNELHTWVENPAQFRDQAWGQVKAAKGIPVIWRVGADQVEAFKKAVGRVPGVKIVP